MKKVFLVSSGSYSAYGIVAVFSSKEKAKDFMQEIREDDYNDIEEYELDPIAGVLVKKGFSPWEVVMYEDGSTERIERLDTDSYQVSRCGSFELRRRKGLCKLFAVVWAKDETHAIKIVNDKRAQMIAMNLWRVEEEEE